MVQVSGSIHQALLGWVTVGSLSSICRKQVPNQ